MNRFDIRDILNAHKEHFRVLPDVARNAVQGIIQAIDHDKEQEKLLTETEWSAVKMAEQKVKTIKETASKKKKESPAGSFTVGKVAKKKVKKKGK